MLLTIIVYKKTMSFSVLFVFYEIAPEGVLLMEMTFQVEDSCWWKPSRKGP